MKQKSPKLGQIMEINVNSTHLSKVLAGVEVLISDNTKFYIVTPNPELILMSQTNHSLKKALNSANFSIPDGVGLKLAERNLKIIKGRKLFMELINLAARKNWKVFLLGGLGKEAELAAENLKRANPGLKIQFSKGPRLSTNTSPSTNADKKAEIEAIDKINTFKPQLLFVAFGNPKQEIWIYRNLSKLKIGGAMAVGGAFRYVSGMSTLPPGWIEQGGLEWLWRVVKEPWRIKRIFKAVIVFPLKFFFYKIIH